MDMFTNLYVYSIQEPEINLFIKVHNNRKNRNGIPFSLTETHVYSGLGYPETTRSRGRNHLHERHFVTLYNQKPEQSCLESTRASGRTAVGTRALAWWRRWPLTDCCCCWQNIIRLLTLHWRLLQFTERTLVLIAAVKLGAPHTQKTFIRHKCSPAVDYKYNSEEFS